tara:strand:- start:380 stop:979 length:600 start_codon:yes stop_codon:yes gene_type:complete
MFTKVIRKVYFSLKKKLISRKALVGRNIIIGRHTKISLMFGSDKKSISVGDNCKIFGVLISQGGGEIQIENNVQVGPGTIIGACESILIKKGALLSNNIKIIDNNNHPVHPLDRIKMNATPVGDELRSWNYSISNPVVIGENTWIGQDSRICKGVTIGDNSIVAANSVVTKDVPANSIVAGNPAKVVKTNINTEKRLFC